MSVVLQAFSGRFYKNSLDRAKLTPVLFLAVVEGRTGRREGLRPSPLHNSLNTRLLLPSDLYSRIYLQ